MYFMHSIKTIVLQSRVQMESQQLANLCTRFLLNQKFDVKLVGNIGNPILSVKKIKKYNFCCRGLILSIGI